MIVFFHIERTAGTLIGQSFQRCGPDRTVRTFDGSLPPLAPALERFPDRRFFVTGHFGFAELKNSEVVTADDHLITVVRDPVDRLVSLFNLFRRNPDWMPRVPANVQDRGIEVFFNECLKRRVYTRNQQCFRISGERSFGAARNAIEKHYGLVGAINHLDQFAAVLDAIVGEWFPHYRTPYQVKVNTARRQEALLDPQLIARIAEDSAEDSQLVAFIEETRGGVFIR